MPPVEAVKAPEVVVIATPWPATEAAVKGLGNLAGKIVIDCTNPLGMRPHGWLRYLRRRAGSRLEPLAMLWIDQVMKRGRGPNFAFAIARRG